MWLTGYWSEHDTTPSCVGLIMWRAWRGWWRNRALLDNTSQELSPLNLKPALGEDEDGESDNIDDEDKRNLTFKCTVKFGAWYFIHF